jgi:hypothetical protein
MQIALFQRVWDRPDAAAMGPALHPRDSLGFNLEK